jgi:hypothetical protein
MPALDTRVPGVLRYKIISTSKGSIEELVTNQVRHEVFPDNNNLFYVSEV